MGALSTATIQPQYLELSPCQVIYKGVDIGATLGNVLVKIESSMGEIKSDQLGSTVIDRRISGMKISVETEIAEILLKSLWSVIFPGYHLVTDSFGNQSYYFDSKVGTSLRSLAGNLTLHPLSHAPTDKSADISIYLATAEPKGDLTFSPSAQSKIKVMWDCYPDFATNPPRFCLFGDPSIGLINASAGAATGATGNVGADTVSAITVFNGFTETEIVTLKCVTAGGAGTGQFYVSGSLSGPQGIATVGSTFTGNVVSFLVNNGSPSATLGDSYSIATVAANYT